MCGYKQKTANRDVPDPDPAPSLAPATAPTAAPASASTLQV